MRFISCTTIITLLMFCNLCSSSQFIQNKTYGTRWTDENKTRMYIRFDSNRFQMTIIQKDNYEYGEGTLSLNKGEINFFFDSIPYKKSVMNITTDNSIGSSERIVIRISVFDAFEKENLRIPTAKLFNSSGNELLSIYGDTAGKISFAIEKPELAQELRIETAFRRDNPPPLKLKGYKGKILHLHYLLNLPEKNFKKKSTQTFYIKQTPLGELILTDPKTQETITVDTEMWKYN